MQVTEMLDLEGRCMNDLFSFFLTSRGIRHSSKSGKSEREKEAGTETERIMAGRQVTPIKCKGGVRLRFP